MGIYGCLHERGHRYCYSFAGLNMNGHCGGLRCGRTYSLKTSQRHARRIRNRRRPNRRHDCRLPLGHSSGAFVRSASAFPVGVVLRLSFQARKFWQSAPVRDIQHRWPHIFSAGPSSSPAYPPFSASCPPTVLRGAPFAGACSFFLH